MNLPDFKTGNPILAEDLQRVSAAIKQARLRPGTGYYLRESNAGTTICFPQGMLGGSNGGATLPCPFQVSDATDEDGMKVQIAWGLIWQMLPTGMQPDNDPPLKMTITATGYVYSKIVFNKDTLIPTSVSFSIETEIKSNSDTTQYNLIAIVTVNTTTQPASITGIQNICIQPFPSPCSLSGSNA